jgi:hypothetical protein
VSKVETWYENDDLWEITAPFMFGEDRWAAASSESEQVISWLQVKPDQRAPARAAGSSFLNIEF